MHWERLGLLCWVSMALPSSVLAAEEQPTMYEIIINGETFAIEGNREVTLDTKQKKGTQYKVALRLAQLQRWVLNSVQFDYDLGFDVDDDGDAGVRTAKLSHELNFTLSVTDLGGGLAAAAQQEVLEKLAEAMTKRLAAERAKDIKTLKPFTRKLRQVAVRGLEISYTDSDGFGRGCMIFVTESNKLCCTCTLEYPSPDMDDALAIAEKTIGSLRAR